MCEYVLFVAMFATNSKSHPLNVSYSSNICQIYIALVKYTYRSTFISIDISIVFPFSWEQAAEFWRVYHAFRRHHLRGSPLAVQRLHELLYAYGNASATGIINKRRRWDFPGSFHFVGTIVSTIGKKRIIYSAVLYHIWNAGDC